MEKTAITISSNILKCKHKNGWFKRVTIKWFIFYFSKDFFLCIDCEDLVPIEYINKTKP